MNFLAASVGVLGVISALGRGPLPLGGSERALLLLVTTIVVGAGLMVRRLRSIAVATGSSVVLAALPWSGAGSALLLALLSAIPMAALLIDGVIRTAVAERPHPLLRAALVVPVLLLTVVGALFAPVKAPALPHAELAAWINEPSAPSGKVAVPAGLWGDLVRDGVSPSRLSRSPEQSTGGRDWVVAVGAPETEARALITFGTGSTALSVLMPAGSEAQEAVADPDRTARQTLGSVLAANARLTAPPDVLTALRDGGVDPRILVVLAGLTADHTVTVGAMPAVGGEDEIGVLRHQVLVTALDGRPTNRPADAEVLSGWLQGQPAQFLPAAVTRDRAGITAVWALPAPPSLVGP
jgi:putative peptide zinc metalloprotease protein